MKLSETRESTNLPRRQAGGKGSVMDNAIPARFRYDSDTHRLVGSPGDIVIKLVGTGVGREWKQIFEYRSSEIEFFFFARSMTRDESNRWVLGDCWSIDGLPRDNPIDAFPIQLDKEKVAAAFAAISVALPLIPEFDARTGSYRTLSSVNFDLPALRPPWAR